MGGGGGEGDPPQQSSVQHRGIGAEALVPHPDEHELEWRAPLVQYEFLRAAHARVNSSPLGSGGGDRCAEGAGGLGGGGGGPGLGEGGGEGGGRGLAHQLGIPIISHAVASWSNHSPAAATAVPSILIVSLSLFFRTQWQLLPASALPPLPWSVVALAFVIGRLQ